MQKFRESRLHCAIATTVAALGLMAPGPSAAEVFVGDLFYTTFAGGPNVFRVAYSYDDVSHAFGLAAPTNIAALPGADGIVFGTNGNLLIGGADSGNVYEINPTTGAIVASQATGTPAYHLALDPSGAKVYTSNFNGGQLNAVGVPIGSGVTSTAIAGAETGVTQVAFGTGGTVFYVQGSPNGFGNVGTIDLGTGVTSRLYSVVEAAHGIVYDPFSDLMTLFGAGRTGTFDAADGSGLRTSAFDFTCDFDQGAVDGKGHALVAGCNGITLIDYSQSGDITNPDFFTTIGGFFNIDDVAPLAGVGAPPPPPPAGVPEPGTIALAGLAGLLLASQRRRRPSSVQ